MRILFIDYETYSDRPIKLCGAYRYFDTPNFYPLLLSWNIVDLYSDYFSIKSPVKVWDFTKQPDPYDLPCQFMDHFANGETLAGWSAFDRLATERILGHEIPLEQYLDVSIIAAELGYPLGLNNAGQAMKCDVKKDPIGHAAIQKFSKPQRNGERLMPEGDQELWDQFAVYCLHDTELMIEIYRKLESRRDACGA